MTGTMIFRQAVDYAERHVIPQYERFDAAHRIDHVRTVIAESLRLADYYPVDRTMVYLAAAFHDTGLCEGRERHHVVSGEILARDPFVTAHFTAGRILIMREAVEDHRASSGREPRTLYGRIVAEADRVIDPDITLRRTVQYGLDHYPDLDSDGHYARMQEHLTRKYAAGGYLRLWCPESDNARRLAELRRIISSPDELRRRFDFLMDALSSTGRR